MTPTIPPRTVLVTGSTRNIGLTMAEWFADRGDRVVVNGRDAAAVSNAVEHLIGRGATAIGVPGDVSSKSSVQEVVQQISDTFGPVEILVNNAVVRLDADIVDTSDADWAGVLDVALTGAFRCIRSVLPDMVDRGWGRIINMSGYTGQRGAPGRVAVVTAKAGLIGLTKAVAMEVAEHGITVNAIAPGPIGTDRRRNNKVDSADLFEQGVRACPAGRVGTQDEIAATCLYFASEGAAYTTGQVLGVNGGLYM